MNSLYPPYNVGGAERSVAELAAALRRAGDDVAVASLAEVKEPCISEEEGVRVHRLPLRNMYWPWPRSGGRGWAHRIAWHSTDVWNNAAAADLKGVLELERPDVLHVNTLAGFSPSIWREGRRSGIPIVQTLRDYGLLCSRNTLFRAGRVCASRCLSCRAFTVTRAAMSERPDFVVSNSQFVIEEHRRQGLFLNTPSEVIFNIAGNAVHKVIRPSFDDEPELVFGFLGRVEQEKGIEVLLNALRKLPTLGWKLKVAGRGEPPYLKRLKRLVSDLPVDWLGFLPPQNFYSAVDTVIIGSVWHEPLPRTLIESLLAGKSTICSTAGGIPEIADLPRVTRSYAPDDVNGLADAMNTALQAPCEWRFGGLDSELPEVFSEEHVVRRYRSVFRRVSEISK